MKGVKKVRVINHGFISYREFSDIALKKIEEIVGYDNLDDCDDNLDDCYDNIGISRENLDPLLEPLYNSLSQNRTTSREMRRYAKDYGANLGKVLKTMLEERVYNQRNLDERVA